MDKKTALSGGLELFCFFIATWQLQKTAFC